MQTPISVPSGSIRKGEDLTIITLFPNRLSEIDIVAISLEGKKVLVAEVKRQRKNFKPEAFAEKVEAIRTKLFFKYKIDIACLSLEDM